MSDLNGGGVLHLVSELKVTRLGKVFENYFQKGFKKELFSKVKLIFEKHNPQKPYIYLLILCLNLCFLLSPGLPAFWEVTSSRHDSVGLIRLRHWSKGK